MKKILLILLFLPLFAMADDLTAILNGNYKPVLMSAEKQDSILNASVSASTETQPRRYRLESENKKQIYRHSFEADYFVVDTLKKTRTQIGGGPLREAKMSPNGRYVSYIKANNLYIFKLDYMTEIPVTTDKTLLNGVADWLYEEEFGITGLFEFSPDNKLIAFIRLNEDEVPSFEWQDFLDGNYPTTHSLRYPRAGEKNPKAELCVYDIYYKSVRTMNLGDTEDCYLPRIKWVGEQILVQKVNRDQTTMEILTANPKSTVSFPLYKEKSTQYYLDYSLFDEWQWLSDGRFIVLSEKDGWKSAFLYSSQGIEQKRLTPDGIDVTKLYGVDEKNSLLYYQAAPTPLTRHCYVCDFKRGNVTKMTSADGMHSFRFSSDRKLLIDNFESNETPNTYTLYENKKGALKQRSVLEDNATVKEAWQNSGLPEKQFLYFVTERRDTLHAWMILPPNYMDCQHPCVLMQYSGPESQRVLNRWRKGFGHYLASQGYVVICSDGRGTGARGRAWRNETYMNLGQKEADDQISTARFAASLVFVDPERIAIMGWSYGGYQAIRTLCEKDNGLKCAVAIAPVTDWRLYDSGYTERFMRRPQVNDRGYQKADLIPLADRMTGDLLIVHGLADDNVHAQHTLKFVDALVQAGKQFEMQIYPDDNHFLRKRSNYEHLHRRIMLFLDKELK